MANQGIALIGIGMDDGPDKAIEAARKAINSPLLEADIKGARKAIINVTGGDDLTINDVNTAIDYIRKEAGGDIDIIFGFANNGEFHNTIIVTIIATGFEQAEAVEITVDSNPTSGNIEFPTSVEEEIANVEDMPTFFRNR